MKDIRSIEFVPGIGGREVASGLKASLKTAASLRAAVAYWCVGPKQLGPDLVSRLSGNGFLCVDVHLPTDIDILAEMVSAGANVYLYLMNPNPQPGELKMHLPPHLMHPKMLLFDYDAAPAELWVGSHNWTARALTGVNIEASLRLRLEKEASLYGDAGEFLEGIRARCVAFDLNAVDYYRWLQGAALEDPMWVLEISGSQSTLEAHNKLSVFGQSAEDYKNLRNVDKSIVVSLLDPISKRETLYEATVIDTGHLTGAGVGFDDRLYAMQDGTPRPLVCGPAVPPPAIRTFAKSWASIELIDKLVGSTIELPPADRWVTESNDVEMRTPVLDLKNWFPRPDKPLIQRAVPREAFERGHVGTSEAALSPEVVGRAPPPQGSARALELMPRLLRKKIVRAIRMDGEKFIVGRQRASKEKDGE
jgi:hypothetical protein